MYEDLINLNINIKKEEVDKFKKFQDFFLKYNEKINLVSRKEVNLLFEKHIFDSLAINLFFDKYKIKNACKIMDIGTGGGFPSIPCALHYKNLNVVALDSINKKINFIRTAKKEFSIDNINIIRP